jgi:F-type H+-transporting ATPase subunit b
MITRRSTAAALLSAAATLPAVASEGRGSSLIEPQIGTIFWTLITFLFLVVVLGRYAWRPLLGALDRRTASIQGDIDGAKSRREEAESLLVQQRELLDQARRERAQAVARGQEEAEKLRAEMLDQARAQREQLLKQTEDQVQAGLRQAQAELRATASDLAVLAAEKLLTKNLDDATNRKLVEDYLAGLESSADPGSLPS